MLTWNRVPAAVLLGLLASAGAAAGQTLRYSDDGESARYRRTQSDRVEQTVNGSRQRSEIDSFWRFTVEPAVGTDGHLTMRIVHDSLAVSVSGAPASPDLSRLTGVPVVVHMDARGSVARVALPESLPAEARRLDLGTTYGTFFPVLPAGDVATGDAWTDTTRVRQEQNGIDLAITRVSRYVVAGPDPSHGPGAIRVTYDADLSLEGSGVQQSADVSLSGTGRAAGEFWFRPDPGVYLGGHEESERRMVGLVHVAGQSVLVPIVHSRTESVEKLD